MNYTPVVGTPKTFQKLSLSTASARSNVLKDGARYRVFSDADVFLVLGGVAVNATTNDTWVLPAGAFEEFTARDDVGLYLAGILASGTGNLYISEIAV